MKKLLLPLAFIVTSVWAQNAVSITTTSSTDIKESNWQKVKKKMSMNYFLDFAGPGIDNPLQTNRRGEDGSPESGNPMNTWNQLSVGYDINDEVRFIVNPRFMTFYGERRDGDGNVLANQELLNPVVGFSYRKKLTEKLRISMQMLTILSNVEEETQDQGLIANPGGFHSIHYQVSNKFAIGSWMVQNFFIYNNDDSYEQERAHRWWVAPYAEYALSDTQFIRGWVGQAWNQRSGSRNWTDIDNVGFEVGLGYDQGFNRHFGIYPFVKMDMSETIGTQNASLGAWIYGTIF